MFFVFSFEVLGLRFVRPSQECAQQRKILRSAPSALACVRDCSGYERRIEGLGCRV